MAKKMSPLLGVNNMRNPVARKEKRRWTTVVMSLTAAPAVVFAQGVQPRVETLENGLKLLMVERREQPVAAAGVFYDVGSVNDPRGQSGIAHLFEHMLFKGSKVIGTTDYEAERVYIEEQEKIREKMNAEMDRMRLMKRRGQLSDVLDPNQWTAEYKALKKQFDDLAESQKPYIKNNELFNLYTTNGGAGLNASTGEDSTQYFVRLPSNKLELFFWLESDRMVNGIMREFYIERDNVREERRLRTESTPTGKLDEAFEAMFWQAHPYGVPVLGWASEVESITAQDVRDFYKIYYAPNNARVVLVGDFDADRVVELAKRYFGRIPPSKVIPRPVITEEPRPLGERRLDAEADTNPRVRLRFPGVAIGHADEPALEVLGGLLSGKTGRLFKRLILEEDAAIGQPFASLATQKYAGYFEVSATVKEGRQPEEVERLLLEEIDKLREGEITERELQRVKNQALASSIQSLKTNMGLMFQLGIVDTWFDWRHINDLPAKIQQVRAEDVRRVVKSYLDPPVRTAAVYRTKKAAGGTDPSAELAAALEKVPADAREQLKAMVDRIKQSEDASRLQSQLERMEQGLASGQMPEDQRAFTEALVKTVRWRLAELQKAAKEKESK
jgi:predicted Zn-dependent peptidase